MLTPLTSWSCLNCGHMTDRGFPILSCCARAVPMRVLVRETGPTADDMAALDEARSEAP